MSNRAVRVTWIDAFCPDDQWYTKEDFAYAAREIVSVGWCILQDRDYLAIAGTYDEHAENYCGVILIPRGCVRRIDDVEELDRLPDDSGVDGAGVPVSPPA